jgi:ferredoxin
MVRVDYHPDGSVTWPEGEPPLPPWPIQPFIATAAGLNTETAVGGSSIPKLENVSIICMAFPMHPKTVEEERNLKDWHFCGSPEFTLNSRIGGHGGFIMALSQYVDRLLQYMGHTTAVPYLCFHWGMRYVQQQFQYAGPTSRTPVCAFPERAWAVAAGLGTYGLNDMLLSKVGMATNLCSIITDVKIPPSPKPAFEYCLYYRDKSCTRCMEVCPVHAIYTEAPGSGLSGRLPGKCHLSAEAMVQYKKKYLVEQTKEAFGPWYSGCNMNYAAAGGVGGSIGEYSTCGQCQCNVPCALEVPKSRKK